MAYSYEWLGYGLEITGPEGSCFMQGDEASQLHEYSVVMEGDDDDQA
jgi:hypothetical protein